ncbi:unnamed protein product [Didymodactylos carnosus]|uniref:Uncharacterized protein n=1 Tax=Didymodactylos carnosus TaxID=1234261 RepID=A0A814RKB8_9BILA|nr:unnamed protein product [Didymodactylos carnosus]CAF3897189.1 unnamed protein product [Didymodactylos carnosus]
MSSQLLASGIPKPGFINVKRDGKSLLKSLDLPDISSMIKDCLTTDQSIIRDIKQLLSDNQGDVSKRKIEQIVIKVDDIERRSRSYNLRFNGVHKGQNPKAKIIEIVKMIDVTITHDDIEVAHFTGAKNVIARFYSRKTCQKLLKHRKKLRKKQSDRKYFVFEDCTKRAMALFSKMRQHLSEDTKFHVYIRNGRVLHRSSLQEKPVVIDRDQTVSDLLLKLKLNGA